MRGMRKIQSRVHGRGADVNMESIYIRSLEDLEGVPVLFINKFVCSLRQGHGHQTWPCHRTIN
jgi:hypothetical protein